MIHWFREQVDLCCCPLVLLIHVFCCKALCFKLSCINKVKHDETVPIYSRIKCFKYVFFFNQVSEHFAENHKHFCHCAAGQQS